MDNDERMIEMIKLQDRATEPRKELKENEERQDELRRDDFFANLPNK